MSTSAILYLISFYASIGGVDPMVARAVASVESELDPNAVGLQKEVGLFQIKSEYVKGISRNQLFDITTNIKIGISKLKEAKLACTHGCENLGWLVVYNCGVASAKKIKHKTQFPYVLQVKKRIASYK